MGIKMLSLETQEEILYFKKYKEELNNFLSSESENLTVLTYMTIVDEVKEVETHIKKLENGN